MVIVIKYIRIGVYPQDDKPVKAVVYYVKCGGFFIMLINCDDKNILQNIRCFALDMDGTIYLGEKWIDGAVDFLARVAETGRKYIFMTNNSSKSASAYIEKLSRMGLVITDDMLITSGQATIRYLREKYPGKRVFLMGNPSLRREFADAGVILDDTKPEVVVTAFDTTLDYQKLCAVCDFICGGMTFIATHPDINCPTETGFVPDIGSFHALIEASTGRRPDKIIGKPNREIIEAMLEKTGSKAGNTAVIGDRLYTDVASGVNNGLTGILVLSGEANLNDLESSDVKPHLIFDSVKEIIPFL